MKSVFLVYCKEFVNVRINKTRAEWTAVRGGRGGGSKARYNYGLRKMRFGQGKVSENQGISFQTKSGHPVIL